jgi:hypothetical protein
MDEITYRLAYDASVRAIEDQARVLEDLRSRAGTMFAAAALVTSFLGGTALASSEAGLTVVTAVGAFVAAALLTLLILWPFRLRLSLSAREIIEKLDGNDGDARVEAASLLRELGLQLETMYDRNARTIRPLFWCFRLAILFLTLEVAAWVVVLWRS